MSSFRLRDQVLDLALNAILDTLQAAMWAAMIIRSSSRRPPWRRKDVR